MRRGAVLGFLSSSFDLLFMFPSTIFRVLSFLEPPVARVPTITVFIGRYFQLLGYLVQPQFVTVCEKSEATRTGSQYSAVGRHRGMIAPFWNTISE